MVSAGRLLASGGRRALAEAAGLIEPYVQRIRQRLQQIFGCTPTGALKISLGALHIFRASEVMRPARPRPSWKPGGRVWAHLTRSAGPHADDGDGLAQNRAVMDNPSTSEKRTRAPRKVASPWARAAGQGLGQATSAGAQLPCACRRWHAGRGPCVRPSHRQGAGWHPRPAVRVSALLPSYQSGQDTNLPQKPWPRGLPGREQRLSDQAQALHNSISGPRSRSRCNCSCSCCSVPATAFIRNRPEPSGASTGLLALIVSRRSRPEV
jgi:hypothetical protein